MTLLATASSWHERLNALNVDELGAMLRRWQRWFGYKHSDLSASEVALLTGEKRDKAKMIALIFSADPIAAEGGVFDFLTKQFSKRDRTMKTTQHDQFVAALTKRGETVDAAKRSLKYTVMTRAQGGYYFIGRSGALRFGPTIKASIKVGDKFKATLKQEAAA